MHNSVHAVLSYVLGRSPCVLLNARGYFFVLLLGLNLEEKED